MSYTKLDAGITDSTVWAAPDATRLTWITMLAMADQHGYVGASIPGLASRARVTLEGCLAALECFMSPDLYSRTKDFEGRRIAEADGGWVLLNHAKYRAMQSADDRRERSRLAMIELRRKRKQETTTVNGYQTLTKLAQAEAEEEVTTTASSVHLDLSAQAENTVHRGECAQARKAAGAARPPKPPKPPKVTKTAQPCPEGVDPQVWADWLALRKAKRAPVTATVIEIAITEAGKAGMPLEAFLRAWCARGSQGLMADWLKPNERPGAVASDPAWVVEKRNRMREFAGSSAIGATTATIIEMEPRNALAASLD